MCTNSLICSKLQQKGSSSKSARDPWGEAELTNFRVRAEGEGDRVTLYPGMEMLSGAKSMLSINLINTTGPILVFP